MTNLAEVHETWKRWFHVSDTNRIDVVLATALSQKAKGTPIWLLIVSNSGDMKSEQIYALDDSDSKEYEVDGNTKMIHRFTPRTLVSGNPNVTDLAPKLKNKLLLIPDMAQLLTLHPNDKSQVWAQLRDLFDGYAGSIAGTGKDVHYKDIRVTLLAGATPALDDQILIHQSLGTRELLYRPKEEIDTNLLMEKVWQNEAVEEEMRREIKFVTLGFLLCRDMHEVEIPGWVEERIKYMANYLSVMRASASIDSYTGELRNTVYPEKPTRALKQLKKLFICLKCLDDNYPDEKALEIVKEVVESSIDPIRRHTLIEVIRNPDSSTNKIATSLRVGQKTARSELYTLWNLGLVDMRTAEGQYRTEMFWSANHGSQIVKDMIRELGLAEYVQASVSEYPHQTAVGDSETDPH